MLEIRRDAPQTGDSAGGYHGVDRNRRRIPVLPSTTIELNEIPDEDSGARRLGRLARAYTTSIGLHDVYHLQGRLDGKTIREVEWTPADGDRTLLGMVADYREYFEGIRFPPVDTRVLPHDADATIRAHGVGLGLLTVQGTTDLAIRIRSLVKAVEAAEAGDDEAAEVDAPDAGDLGARTRQIALYRLTWPSRQPGDRKTIATRVTLGLQQGLRDRAPAVREAAAALVARLRILALVDDLRRLLDDPEASTRAAVIRALRSIDGVAAIPATVGMLGDDSDSVRQAAFATLSHLQHLPWQRRRTLMDDLADEILAAWSWFSEEQRVQVLDWTMGCQGDRVLAALLAIDTHEESSAIRARIVTAIGSMERADALPPLVQRLQDPDPEVCTAVIEAMAYEPLQSALRKDAALLATVLKRLETLSVTEAG